MKGQGGRVGERDDEITGLWEKYQSDRSTDNRNRLALAYGHLVTSVLQRVMSTCRTTRRDLAQEGQIGLLQAIERYDPLRHIRFETFAWSRIRGAMLDALRADDHLPRLARRRHELVQAAIDAFVAEHGIEPDGDQLDALLAEDDEAERGRQIAEHADAQTDDAAPLVGDVADHRETSPPAREQMMDMLEQAFAHCSPQERLVLALHVAADMPTATVGRLMGLSRSRVSQIYTRVCARLRGELS